MTKNNVTIQCLLESIIYPMGHILKVISMETSQGTSSHEDSTQPKKWQEMFDAETRQGLLEADRDAWRTVVALLMIIVSIGLCLGFLGAAMSVWL